MRPSSAPARSTWGETRWPMGLRRQLTYWQLLSQDDHSIQEGNGTAPVTETTTVDGGASLRTETPHPPPGHPSSIHDAARFQMTANGYGDGGAYNYARGGEYSHGVDGRYHGHHAAWADAAGEGEDEEGSCDGDPPGNGVVGAVYTSKQQPSRSQFEREALRTIQLSNLAEGTTHADITNAVRGGILLDVFLRSNDRTATVSFLQPTDAKKFLEHVRKHDMYIRNKRVSDVNCVDA